MMNNIEGRITDKGVHSNTDRIAEQESTQKTVEKRTGYSLFPWEGETHELKAIHRETQFPIEAQGNRSTACCKTQERPVSIACADSCSYKDRSGVKRTLAYELCTVPYGVGTSSEDPRLVLVCPRRPLLPAAFPQSLSFSPL